MVFLIKRAAKTLILSAEVSATGALIKKYQKVITCNEPLLSVMGIVQRYVEISPERGVYVRANYSGGTFYTDRQRHLPKFSKLASFAPHAD